MMIDAGREEELLVVVRWLAGESFLVGRTCTMYLRK